MNYPMYCDATLRLATGDLFSLVVDLDVFGRVEDPAASGGDNFLFKGFRWQQE
jgi:hypothetical protein